MARVEAPAWLYYADFVPDAQKGKVPGATHGSDAYYLWGGQLSPDPGTQRFANAMRDYWLNFARSGNPNGESLPTWPQYDPQSGRWLVLSDPPAVQSDVIKARLDFLERRYRQRVDSLLPGQ